MDHEATVAALHELFDLPVETAAEAADDLAMVELLIAGCEPPMGPAEISGWRSAHRLRAAFA